MHKKKRMVYHTALALLVLASCSIYQEPEVLSPGDAQERLKSLYNHMEYIQGQMGYSEYVAAIWALNQYLQTPLIQPNEPVRERPPGVMMGKNLNANPRLKTPYRRSIEQLPYTVSTVLFSRVHRPRNLVMIARHLDSDDSTFGVVAVNGKNTHTGAGVLDFTDSTGLTFTGIYRVDDSRLRWIADTTTYRDRLVFQYPLTPQDTANNVSLTITNFSREAFRGTTFTRSVNILMEIDGREVLNLKYAGSFIRGFPQHLSFDAAVGSWTIDRRLILEWRDENLQIRNTLSVQEGLNGVMASNIEQSYIGGLDANPFVVDNHGYRLASLDGYTHVNDIKVEYRVDVAALDSLALSGSYPFEEYETINRYVDLRLLTFPTRDWLARIHWAEGEPPADSEAPSLKPWLLYSDSTTVEAFSIIPDQVLIDFDFML